jgi:hypothetical protein
MVGRSIPGSHSRRQLSTSGSSHHMSFAEWTGPSRSYYRTWCTSSGVDIPAWLCTADDGVWSDQKPTDRDRSNHVALKFIVQADMTAKKLKTAGSGAVDGAQRMELVSI